MGLRHVFQISSECWLVHIPLQHPTDKDILIYLLIYMPGVSAYMTLLFSSKPVLEYERS